MSSNIKTEVLKRGITRLCHFTPSRNLGQILSGRVGILSTTKLRDDERNVFTPTDLQRLDGFPDHISCSIEFPNAWYFDRARSKEVVFRDWVVLFIDPKYLWFAGTKFCPRNAASSRGTQVATGESGFKMLFENSVLGAYGNRYSRTDRTLPCCPTDEQAEVLVPDVIAMGDISGIAVPTREQAQNEVVRLKLMGVSDEFLRSLQFSIAPVVFEKYQLSASLKRGERPPETPFKPEV